MAERIFAFDVVVPANTAIASPVVQALTLPPVDITSVSIVIPDGHLGLTGIALGVAGVRIIPESSNTYIVGNDEDLRFDVSGYPDSGAWQAFAYNLDDTFQHSFHIRLFCDLIEAGAPGTPVVQLPVRV